MGNLCCYLSLCRMNNPIQFHRTQCHHSLSQCDNTIRQNFHKSASLRQNFHKSASFRQNFHKSASFRQNFHKSAGLRQKFYKSAGLRQNFHKSAVTRFLVILISVTPGAYKIRNSCFQSPLPPPPGRTKLNSITPPL